MELGATIKKLRRKKRWTRYRLSQESGVARGWIARIEEGDSLSTSMETYDRLARGLGVDLNYLIMESLKESEHGVTPDGISEKLDEISLLLESLRKECANCEYRKKASLD